MTPQAVDTLERVIGEHIPGFAVCYKNDAPIMKALGFLVRPFNPRFMTEYTTTWGSKVYFPSRPPEEKADRRFITLAHEFVHLWDSKEQGISFKLSYAAPQVYAVAPLFLHAAFVTLWPLLTVLGSYVLASAIAKTSLATSWIVLGLGALVALVLAVLLSGWYTLLLAGGLTLLAPWPSRGRTRSELRGYGMNVSIYTWLRGQQLEAVVIDDIAKQFTGPGYYFMSRDGEAVKADLEKRSLLATMGAPTEQPYRLVYDLLMQETLAR